MLEAPEFAKRPGVSGHTSTASQMSTGSPGTSSYKGRKLTDTDKSLCSQNNAAENFQERRLSFANSGPNMETGLKPSAPVMLSKPPLSPFLRVPLSKSDIDPTST